MALWVPISSCFTCLIWRVNSTWHQKMSSWHLITSANQIILSPPNLSLFGKKKRIVSFALNHLPLNQRKIIPCHPSLWFHKVHQLTNHIAGGPSRNNLISQPVHGKKKVYMLAMSTSNMQHGIHPPKCPIHRYVHRNAEDVGCTTMYNNWKVASGACFPWSTTNCPSHIKKTWPAAKIAPEKLWRKRKKQLRRKLM